MRVAIVGSRNFPVLGLVRYAVACLQPEDVVVSGGARGVDALAAGAAQKDGLSVQEYCADWTQGRGAGDARNATIINDADLLIAFWDGESRGTQHSIGLARKAKKAVLVITLLTLVKDVSQDCAKIEAFIAEHTGRQHVKGHF